MKRDSYRLITTSRYRFARAAHAPRAKRNFKNRGRALPVKKDKRTGCVSSRRAQCERNAVFLA